MSQDPKATSTVDIEFGDARTDITSLASPLRGDPFAPRDGKTLTWRHVNMTLSGGNKKGEEDQKVILGDVWGEVPARQTTAIMGPSGAGKTSLLNILAGRAASRGRIKIDADVRLNNYEVDPTNLDVRKQIAFVAQDDSLQATSTPREAIRFSARLRLPRGVTNEEIEQLTNRMLEELSLEDCADTIVGGALIKGISGGQRKRTSVGVELVTKPALVFLDEPTSGLDSFSAIQLCQVLKKVANAGSSVLFTIHQPSSEIFTSFDHLILMNKGRVMYQGAVQDIPTFFETGNHPVPANYNPADWIMNVAQSVNVDTLESCGFFPSDHRPMEDAFQAEYTKGRDALGITTRSHGDGDSDNRPVGMLTEIRLLFSRELVNVKRDTTALMSKFGLNIFLAVLVGVIFFDVGNTSNEVQSNVQSRFGALIICMMMGMFGTAEDALLQFPQERPVFLREYSTNHYSVVSYFLSRLTMEALVVLALSLVLGLLTYFMIGFQMSLVLYVLIIYTLSLASTALAVFLGSCVEDPKLAMEMLPILFVPQMLFAGFFVTPELIPSWLRWAQYLCSLTYSTRLMVLEEFEACEGPGAENCINTISSIEAESDEKWWYWIVLLGLFAFFRVAALLVLRKKATKFF